MEALLFPEDFKNLEKEVRPLAEGFKNQAKKCGFCKKR